MLASARTQWKIRLVEPRAPSLHMWSYSRCLRLGLPIIGAALKAAGHDVLIHASRLRPRDVRDLRGADLVGISTTTSTAPAAYAIADRLRAWGVPTVLGGSHVTFFADEALEHADFVGRGEGGDALMLELIDALEGRRAFESVAGLSFRRGVRHVHNEARELAGDLDAVPVPDLSLFAGGSPSTTPIMTSWGCPFACNFCSVTAMFGRKVRWRDTKVVITELLAKRPQSISFYDDNFAADKARTKDLLRAMIDAGVTVSWQAQVRTDVVRDPELMDLMRRSGCSTLALGLESIDQATLDAFQKSQSVADVGAAVDVVHEYGINVHGMFVVGADSDTVQTIRDTVDFALEHRIDTLMLNILTPAPGTLQFERMDADGRIFTKDWRLYDAQHVVFWPSQMTPAQLQREVLCAHRRFFSSRRCLEDAVGGRADRVPLDAWLWWYARSWHAASGNRAHLKRLEAMTASAGGRGGLRRAPSKRTGAQ